MEAAVSDGNNVMEFLQSKGYLTFFSEAEASTKELYAAYKLWCEDNVLNPQTCNSFSRYLNENQELYHIRYSNNIYVSGRRVRGYIGIEPEHKLPI